MNDKLSKFVSWTLYGLMAVSALLAILFYTGSITEDTIMQWSYILLVLALIIAVASPVYNYILSPGNPMKILLSFGLVAVIAIISYAVAGNTFSALKLESMNITAETSKWVGMGLMFTYITGILAFTAIIFSSFYKIFK